MNYISRVVYLSDEEMRRRLMVIRLRALEQDRHSPLLCQRGPPPRSVARDSQASLRILCKVLGGGIEAAYAKVESSSPRSASLTIRRDALNFGISGSDATRVLRMEF